MNRYYILGLAALALGSAARADDLAAVFKEALANNATFRSAQAQYAAVDERIPQSRAALLPALSASYNSTWNDNHNNNLGPQKYNSNGWTLTLTQPLWHPAYGVALDQAHAQRDQAEAQVAQARQDLAIHTAQAYFDVLYAEDALATFRAQRAANKQQLEQAQRGYDVGTASITDVRDAKARFDLLTAQEISAVNEVTAKTNALRQIIGGVPGPLAPLREGIELKRPSPDSLAPWERAAEANNPLVIAGSAAVQVAELEAHRISAGRMPSVDLVATRGYNSSASTITVGQVNQGDTIGVQVTMPIDVAGAVSAKRREAINLRRKAEADLDDARRTSVLSAQQSYLGATSGIAQVEALEEAVKSAQVALQSNNRGMEVGTRINVDVLNAQQQLSVTTRDLAKSRYDTVMALLRLKAAAGSLSDADIEEVNALLAR